MVDKLELKINNFKIDLLLEIITEIKECGLDIYQLNLNTKNDELRFAIYDPIDQEREFTKSDLYILKGLNVITLKYDYWITSRKENNKMIYSIENIEF